jgi:hypothetical protein
MRDRRFPQFRALVVRTRRTSSGETGSVFDLAVDEVSPHHRFLCPFQKVLREEFFFQLQKVPAEIVVLVEHREIFSNRCNQVVIHRHWNVVSEQRCVAGGWMIADLCRKDVGSDRGSQRGGQAVFVIIKFLGISDRVGI